MTKPLFKTTAVIWSERNPEMELSDLAKEAETGDCYCSVHRTIRVEDPSKDGPTSSRYYQTSNGLQGNYILFDNSWTTEEVK